MRVLLKVLLLAFLWSGIAVSAQDAVETGETQKLAEDATVIASTCTHAECTKVLAHHLEQINSKSEQSLQAALKKREEEVREELNSAHQAEVVKLTDDMQRNAETGVSKLQQEFEETHKGEIDLIHKEWGDRLNRAADKWEASLELAQKQVTDLKQELVKQRALTNKKQASVEEAQKELIKVKDTLFHVRREAFQTREHIREIEAKATYCNTTLIRQDAGALVMTIADKCRETGDDISAILSPWWNKAVETVGPVVSIAIDSYKNQVAPQLEKALHAGKALYVEHVSPHVDKGLQASKDLYMEHLDPTLAPALEPVLEMRQTLFQSASVAVARVARLTATFLEIQEDDSKIRLSLLDLFRAIEKDSEAVVRGAEWAFCILLVLWLVVPLFSWRKRRALSKKRQTSTAVPKKGKAPSPNSPKLKTQ